MTARRLAAGVITVVVVLAVAAALVWFLRGDPGDDRNTSGFAPPKVTQGSFCSGVAGFRADVAAVDPATDPSAYVAQVRTAAQRLRSSGTPAGMPADARAGLAAYLDQILALPDGASAADVRRLGKGGSATEQRQRTALAAYLAQECPDVTG